MLSFNYVCLYLLSRRLTTRLLFVFYLGEAFAIWVRKVNTRPRRNRVAAHFAFNKHIKMYLKIWGLRNFLVSTFISSFYHFTAPFLTVEIWNANSCYFLRYDSIKSQYQIHQKYKVPFYIRCLKVLHYCQDITKTAMW